MSFDTARALRKSTGRAKSDVANKLVSMFLHEVSRKACAASGSGISDPAYSNDVVRQFGARCLYCDRDLENDRAAVEHLDGMNRFRVGLHVPGNVAMACRRCNNEKRRDDQKPSLILAGSGWESFLAHDGSHCPTACGTCEYWRTLMPDAVFRGDYLRSRRESILLFRQPYRGFVEWSSAVRPALLEKLGALYRDCQNFATQEIQKLTSGANIDYSLLKGDPEASSTSA